MVSTKLVVGILVVVVLVGGLGVVVAANVMSWGKELEKLIGIKGEAAKEPVNNCIKFYVALIAYFVLHMIFVIASDFVEAFNISPINIGIYVGKLVSLRSLLMFVSSLLEWILAESTGDNGLWPLAAAAADPKERIRRSCSIMSFVAMLVCRLWYLWLIYKSDKKSLTVFITLSVESFWFGLFQISFFAIGPKYAAVSTLGVHTMGNFIFWLQLFLERLAKTMAKLDSLYRVRVHGWICFATSYSALCWWIGFCYDVKGTGDSGNSDPNAVAAASAFLMFPIGSAIKDFLYPGVLPFGLLDPGKAALINYWTPLFIMAGAIFVVADAWSKTEPKETHLGKWARGSQPEWHAVWLWLLPMATAYLVSMWCIHGTFGRLRCIVQSRWRVWLLSLFVIVPNSFLEDISYVGVATWATADLTNNKDNLHLIPAHNMLAMLCRFLNGKLAVGYNWTRVDMGYCLPKFRPRHRGFGFGFWWWCGRVLARAWADTAKDFKADVKNYL